MTLCLLWIGLGGVGVIPHNCPTSHYTDNTTRITAQSSAGNHAEILKKQKHEKWNFSEIYGVNGIFLAKVQFSNLKRKQISDWVFPAGRKNSIKDQKKVTLLCFSPYFWPPCVARKLFNLIFLSFGSNFEAGLWF